MGWHLGGAAMIPFGQNGTGPPPLRLKPSPGTASPGAAEHDRAPAEAVAGGIDPRPGQDQGGAGTLAGSVEDVRDTTAFGDHTEKAVHWLDGPTIRRFVGVEGRVPLAVACAAAEFHLGNSSWVM